MKKILFMVCGMIMAAAFMTGCGKSTAASSGTGGGGAARSGNAAGENAAGQAGTEGKTYKVGYCINNFNDTFQTYIVDALKAYIKENGGVELLTSDAQEDVVRQQDNVNSLIAKGVDALIVVPVDTSAMEPITKAAQKAGIPLCYVNRNPYSGKEDAMPDGVYYVGSQEIKAGQMQMENIGEKLGGKGGIAILQGILSNEGAVKRTEGNEEVIKNKYPDVKLLSEQSGEWQRDKAMSITENWITAYGNDLNAILANNDEMALGAVRALQSAGRKDVLVMGIDGIPDALAAIKAGTMAGSVLQDARGQGEGSIQVIEKALKGEKPDHVDWVDFKLITGDNVADFE